MTLLEVDVSDYETLFLDRDGVINVHRPNDYVKSVGEFEFIPGIMEALSIWNKHFKHIIIITNQRGVGKGLMTEEDLLIIHNYLIEEIEKSGGRIDKIYSCTAVADDDLFRKPNIGMALKAKQDFPDIDFSLTLMIGDNETDKMFAKNIGAGFICL